jgi:hypothetical protein
MGELHPNPTNDGQLSKSIKEGLAMLKLPCTVSEQDWPLGNCNEEVTLAVRAPPLGYQQLVVRLLSKPELNQ